MINAEQLVLIMPSSNGRAVIWSAALCAAMTEFGVDSPRRAAAFLAQVAHESGQLRYTREIGTKNRPAGSQYEGRADLGNTQPGDGRRFCGRGLIQLTGRHNYRDCGAALGLDLLQNPELLESPRPACRSAGWFWQFRGLNRFADVDQFGSLSRAINGGFNGIDDRIEFWLRARETLGVKPL